MSIQIVLLWGSTFEFKMIRMFCHFMHVQDNTNHAYYGKSSTISLPSVVINPYFPKTAKWDDIKIPAKLIEIV